MTYVKIRHCKLCRQLHMEREEITLGCGMRTVRYRLFGSMARYTAIRPQVSWGGGQAFIEKQQAAILRRLLAGPASMGEVIDWMWGEDVDGGPDDACGFVRVRLAQLRTKLRAAGLPIEFHDGNYQRYELRVGQPIVNAMQNVTDQSVIA